ncbi:MAG: Lacal_2735 family protein [Saprospiraceae bacterium]|nr:Lacal_2735 family protein [Saprospiraceae bacterium]
MFNFLKKDPTKDLQKVINRKLEQARDVQRSGDIKAYALLMGEIDELQKKLETYRS